VVRVWVEIPLSWEESAAFTTPILTVLTVTALTACKEFYDAFSMHRERVGPCTGQHVGEN